MELHLENLEFWPRSSIESLARIGIDAVPQLIATARTAGGIDALAQQCDVDRAVMAKLVEQTEAYCRAAGLDQHLGPVNTRQFGLGAIRPPDPQS